MTVVDPDLAPLSTEEIEEERARLIQSKRLRRVSEHPIFLTPYVRCFDSEKLEEFEFGAPGWEWQGDLLQFWMDSPKSIVLKCRQIGITWLAGLWALHNLQFQPGSRSLWVSINEKEASKAINRIWDMRESLPKELLRGTKVIKPARNTRPTGEIQVQHPGGRVSTVVALPSTPKAGRGETAKLVVLDEFAFQEYAEDTWTAVLPTAAKGGNIVIISTANGVSTVSSGGDVIGGNFYHHLWEHSDHYSVKSRFFPWSIHPGRDPVLFAEERLKMPPKVRAQEYPETEREAFWLTGDKFFDAEALDDYERNLLVEPLFRGRFVPEPDGATAKFVRGEFGPLRVFELPIKERKYAIGADTATGKGQDYSAATVIDLSTARIVARFHARLGVPEYAAQLHFLGKWFNDAIIAPERAGGYGDALIILLRDGKDGRPAYPHLYRHRQFLRGDQKQMGNWGFPTSSTTRPLILEYLARVVSERALPALDRDALKEYSTFIYRDSNPSPRAAEGAHDDMVMADAIALELFRQRGEHPRDVRKRRRRTSGKPAQLWAGEVAA